MCVLAAAAVIILDPARSHSEADLTPLPPLGINRPLLNCQAFPMSFSPLIRQLIDGLRILPGVGQKTAQRMALQLLERDRSGGCAWPRL